MAVEGTFGGSTSGRVRGSSMRSAASYEHLPLTLSIEHPPTSGEMIAAHAQRIDAESETAPVGKVELLEWVSQVSGQKCTRFDDLRDGSAVLRVFAAVFPAAADLSKIDWRPNARPGTPDAKLNWDTVQAIMAELGLPREALDRKGVARAKFKPVFQFTVMLYFLHNLSQSHDFAVDFSHPIDEPLASFLQSTASVDALRKGGALIDELPEGSNASEAPQQQPGGSDGGGSDPEPTPVTAPTVALPIPQPPPPEPALTHAAPATAPAPQSAARANLSELVPGAEVSATGMSGELNGARGRVVGQKQHADGMRVAVLFAGNPVPMLVRPQNLQLLVPPPPPYGTEVELVDAPGLSGLRGRVLGQRVHADCLRALVELPPPHGQMLVHPRNLSVLAPPPPPVGATVEVAAEGQCAEGMPVAQGLRGRVRAVQHGPDGPCCLVACGGSAMRLVSVRLLRVVEWPMPHSGDAVAAVDMPESPELCGVVGRVLGQQQASDGMRCLVAFPPPHGQMLVRPERLAVLPAAGESGEAAPLEAGGAPPRSPSHSVGSRVPPAEPISEQGLRRLESLRARGDQRVEHLEQQLAQQRDRVAALAALADARGVQRPPVDQQDGDAEPGQALWRDEDQRARGEALVARLSRDSDSAARRLHLAECELAALRHVLDLSTQQLRAAAEMERSAAPARHQCELLWAEARRRRDELRMRAGLLGELHSVRGRLQRAAAEAAQDVQGTAALREQLVLLRQLRAADTALLAAGDVSNARRGELKERVEELAQRECARADAADQHCGALLGLLSGAGCAPGDELQLEPGASAADGTDRGEIAAREAQSAACTAAAAAQGESEQSGGALCAALALAARAKVLARVAAAERCARAREGAKEPRRHSEGSGERCVRGRSESNGPADTEENPELQRLRERARRLEEQAAYLRAVSARGIAAVGDASSRASSPAFCGRRQSPICGQPAAQGDALPIDRIAAALRSADLASLWEHFWQLAAEQEQLMHTCASAEAARRAARSRRDAAARRLGEERAESAAVTAETQASHRIVLEEVTVSLSAEQEHAASELRLTQEELRRVRAAQRADPPQRIAQAVAGSVPEEQRFPAVSRRAAEASAALACSGLREDLLAQLCDAVADVLRLREQQQDLADGATAAALRAGELAAEGLRYQLTALPPPAAPQPVAPEEAAAEAGAGLRKELAAAETALASAGRRAAAAEARVRAAAVAIQAVQLSADAVQGQRGEAQQQCAALLQECRELRGRVLVAQHAEQAAGEDGAPPGDPELAELAECAAALGEDCAELGAADELRLLLRQGTAAGPFQPPAHRQRHRPDGALPAPLPVHSSAPPPLVSALPRLADMPIDGYESVLSAALPGCGGGGAARPSSPSAGGLGAAMQLARRQIDDILASTDQDTLSWSSPPPLIGRAL